MHDNLLDVMRELRKWSEMLCRMQIADREPVRAHISNQIVAYLKIMMPEPGFAELRTFADKVKTDVSKWNDHEQDGKITSDVLTMLNVHEWHAGASVDDIDRALIKLYRLLLAPSSRVWKRFAAEILFLNPDDVPDAIEALAAAGCEWEYEPEAIDDQGPAMFGMVTGNTKLDEADICHWLRKIIDPLGGDVVQWRIGEPWKIGSKDGLPPLRPKH